MITRRAFLAGAIGLPFLGGAAAGGYMRLWEPDWYEVTNKEAKVKGIRKSVRVLHLSDFHASSAVPYDYIESAVEASLQLNPDLAFLTGDFITSDLQGEPTYRKILSKISNTCPTYACIGNHDGGKWAGSTYGYPTFELVQQLLEKSNVHLLFNRAESLQVNGNRLQIIGLGDFWSGDTKPQGLLYETRQQENPVLVLCHNPDAKATLRTYDWDIMFCGHTHGGQLVIPFLGLRPFLPVRDKRYAEGLLEYQDKLIHITRGVGNLHGLRFNCRPELSMVTLV